MQCFENQSSILVEAVQKAINNRIVDSRNISSNILQDTLQKYKESIENILMLKLEEVKNKQVVSFTSISSNKQVSTTAYLYDNRYIFACKSKFWDIPENQEFSTKCNFKEGMIFGFTGKVQILIQK